MARTKQTFRRAQAQRALRVGTQSHAHYETTLVPATQSAELPAAAAVMPPHEQCQDEAVTQCVDETHSNTPTSKPADIARTPETAALQPVPSSTPPAVSAQQQHEKKRKVSSAE